MKDNKTSINAMFQLGEYPILDVEAAVKITGSEEVLADMLELMLNDIFPEDLTLMKDAYADGDWKRVLELVHKIRGGVIYVGAVRIKMACQYLEEYWQEGRRQLLEKLYQQMLAVIDESEKYFNNWLSKVCQG